jgi:hypothetical protein
MSNCPTQRQNPNSFFFAGISSRRTNNILHIISSCHYRPYTTFTHFPPRIAMLLTWWTTVSLIVFSQHKIFASATHDQYLSTTQELVEPFHENTSLLRGATNNRRRNSRKIVVERAANQRQTDRVTIFMLLLFGSQNAALTSWNVSDLTPFNTTLDDNNLLPTVQYSAAIGTYSPTTTDTTELIRLLPGHYYQFTVSDASKRHGTGIDYTWVLSEPALSLASGQILAGQTQSAMIYVPTVEEAMSNITMPSSAPSMAPTIDCVIRGERCVTGSDCCSKRCSPELICYPEGTKLGDRDKLTLGEGGAGGGP